MKVKLIGYRDRSWGNPGYYIRISLNLCTQADKDAIKTWCILYNGEIIDHSTLYFAEEEIAKKFLETLN